MITLIGLFYLRFCRKWGFGGKWGCMDKVEHFYNKFLSVGQ